MSRWDELEKAARKIGLEEWERDPIAIGSVECCGLVVAQVQSRIARDNDHRNEIADYIAAANPKTVLTLIGQNRELVLQLRDALSQMTKAAESISEGRYDEALLHCASMHRPKLEAIRKTTGEEA